MPNDARDDGPSCRPYRGPAGASARSLGPAAGAAARLRDEASVPKSPSSIRRPCSAGRTLLVARCGFCHGSNARGGSGGSDLTRSPIVQEDENGKQLGEFLKVGRPDRGMPKFELAATGGHRPRHLPALDDLRRWRTAGDYKILDIVTGDAQGRRGVLPERGCGSCHSVEGDLKGVGAKYDAPTLQGRLLMPRGAGAAGRPGTGLPTWTRTR